MAEPADRSRRAEAQEQKRRREEREEAQRAARLARAEARRARQAAFRARLAREVLHAGEGVSGQLAHSVTDEARLLRHGLPVVRDAAELAALLEIDMGTLRWLTYHREVAGVTHYRQFQVPKARGGFRTIAAPRPRLRAALRAVRERLLRSLPVSAEAQGFVPGRSTVSNAARHVGRRLLVKVDLRDFFGTITLPRVRGLFRALGYSGSVASLLALLVTEAPRAEVLVGGRRWYVAHGPRALPQGAPTSPDLTNQIARRLDRRVAGYAARHGWTYTRYADDLTFSRQDGGHAEVGRLLGTLRAILTGEGFRLHPEKVFVVRSGRQQRVTGIVVNDVLSLPRDRLRRFRAAVHRVTKEGRFRDAAEQDELLGYAAYVCMVKPQVGRKLLTSLRGVGA